MKLWDRWRLHRKIRTAEKILIDEKWYITDIEKSNKYARDALLLASSFSSDETKKIRKLEEVVLKRVNRQIIDFQKLRTELGNTSLGKFFVSSFYLQPKLDRLIKKDNSLRKDDFTGEKVYANIEAEKLSSLREHVEKQIDILIEQSKRCKMKLSTELKREELLSSEETEWLRQWLEQEAAALRELDQSILVFADLIKKTFSKWKLSRRAFLGHVGAAAIITARTGAEWGAGIVGLYGGLKLATLRLPRRQTNALAILVGDVSVIITIPLVREIYAARMELAFGTRAKVVNLHATREDFFRCLFDSSIQHMAVFGHGTWN